MSQERGWLGVRKETDRLVLTCNRGVRRCEHSSLLPPSPTKLPDGDTQFHFPQEQNPLLVGFFRVLNAGAQGGFSERLLNEGVTKDIRAETAKLLVYVLTLES